MQTDAPFEWLTNFRSLRHIVLPSRVAYGNPSSEESNDDHHHNGHDVEQLLSLNAFHVGCGTSAVGESLACLREQTHNGLGAHRYGYVLNVDNNLCALHTMQRRWEDRRQNPEGELVGQMEWKCLDFDNDESCRYVMDDVYSRILMQSTTITSDETACNNDEQLGGCFDLVLDKSTLDCLLCAETDIVARFLCEVYRALKIPSNTVSNHHRLGGVYILITFHPAEFIMKLLNDLPGTDWTVEYEVIKREIEDIKLVNKVCSIEDLYDDKSKNTSQNSTENKASSSSSAWQSSGTFEPDENYRRTITVFTCRRDSPVMTKNDEGMPLVQPSYMLFMKQVQMHIERTCDDWYQATNPMVTSEREANMRKAFVNETVLQLNDDNEEVMLDLKTCYHILFTEAEKEHLDYVHFLEDWDAYCNNEIHSYIEPIRRDGMTMEIALDFLKVMQ